MENYQVSARKYRPTTFDSVVGQQALTATLKSAISRQRLAHAYLFCGSRGIGKTSCARIFAKTINCEHPTADGNPCNECDSCRAFNENRSLNIIELDAASNNGVDNIRELVEQVQVPPTAGKYRVFIIDEVHMLSSGAFNAFLKTLEEPPSYVIFILATTEKQKILPTILSRCQIYDFKRITIADIVNHLEFVARNEGITAERSALNVIAEKADGGMRDALSIFDQVAAASRGNITYQSTIDSLNVLDRGYYSRLFQAIHNEDVPEALLVFKDVRDHGFDTHFFINGVAKYVRTLMLASNPATLPLIDAEPDVLEQYRREASLFTPDFFYKAMSLCNEADLNYRLASDKTFLAELLLIRLCQQLSPSPISDGAEEGQLKPIAGKPMPAEAAVNIPKVTLSGSVPTAPQPQAQTPTVSPATTAGISRPGGIPLRTGTRTSRITRGPRLSDIEAEEKKEQELAAMPSVKRNSPYTTEAVAEGWSEFIAAHPANQLLMNSLRKAIPERIDGDIFSVTLDNPAQEAELNLLMPDLYTLMHNRLSNDLWELRVRIDQSEGSPATWTEREILNHTLDSCEPLRDLFETFQLKL